MRIKKYVSPTPISSSIRPARSKGMVRFRLSGGFHLGKPGTNGNSVPRRGTHAEEEDQRRPGCPGPSLHREGPEHRQDGEVPDRNHAARHRGDVDPPGPAARHDHRWCAHRGLQLVDQEGRLARRPDHHAHCRAPPPQSRPTWHGPQHRRERQEERQQPAEHPRRRPEAESAPGLTSPAGITPGASAPGVTHSSMAEKPRLSNPASRQGFRFIKRRA